MRKFIAALLLLFPLASPVLAEEDESEMEEGDAPAFELSVNPEKYPVKEFKKRGFKTKTLPHAKVASLLPDKRTREAVFSRVIGLAEQITHMDEMDRDILFVKARSKSLMELKKSYPQISADTLSRLHKRIRDN